MNALGIIRWIRLEGADGVTGIRIGSMKPDSLGQYITAFTGRAEQAASGTNRHHFLDEANVAADVLLQYAPSLEIARWLAAEGLNAESIRRRLDELDDLEAEARRKAEGLIALVNANAEAAIATHYHELAEAEMRAQAAALARFHLTAWVGPALLLLSAALWGWVVWLSPDLQVGLETLALGLTFKLPLALAWIWLLRLASRDYSAALHRGAVATAKRAALLTYDMLSGRATSDAGNEALLASVAPLVFDPASTGIGHHGDTVTIGPQSVSLGQSSS